MMKFSVCCCCFLPLVCKGCMLWVLSNVIFSYAGVPENPVVKLDRLALMLCFRKLCKGASKQWSGHLAMSCLWHLRGDGQHPHALQQIVWRTWDVLVFSIVLAHITYTIRFSFTRFDSQFNSIRFNIMNNITLDIYLVNMQNFLKEKKIS